MRETKTIKLVLLGGPATGKLEFFNHATEGNETETKGNNLVSFGTYNLEENTRLQIWNPPPLEKNLTEKDPVISYLKETQHPAIFALFIDLDCTQKSLTALEHCKGNMPENAKYIVVFTKSKSMSNPDEKQLKENVIPKVTAAIGISDSDIPFKITSKADKSNIQNILNSLAEKDSPTKTTQATDLNQDSNLQQSGTSSQLAQSISSNLSSIWRAIPSSKAAAFLLNTHNQPPPDDLSKNNNLTG